jgi:hypothetical protein
MFYDRILKSLIRINDTNYTQNKLVCENDLPKVLILSKDEVYIDQSGNVHIDQSGNVHIDQSGNAKLFLKVNHYQEMYYQDIYRPEHLLSKFIKTCKISFKYKKTYEISSKYIKTFIVFITKTLFF